MHKYTFGFNVFNQPPEDFITYSIENKLNHIEINLSKSHSSIYSFDDRRIEALKKSSFDSDINFSLHLPNHINVADNISTKRRSDIKYLNKVIDLAIKLQVKYINCHMGFFFWFPVQKWQRDKALKRFIDNIKIVADKCEQNNILIALENVTPLPDGSEHLLLGDNINDLEFVFSNLDSSIIKFCLDTGHANLAEGVNTYLNAFSEKLIAIHYHDNLGNDDSHLVVGEGNINWEQFAKILNNIKFNGPLISECRNYKPHEAALKFKKFLV